MKWLIAVVFTILATTAVPEPLFDPTNRPIEIVVPFSPGGGSYNIAVLVNQIFEDHGWKSYVSTRPGGNSIIAANYVTQARTDGHTLLQTGSTSIGINIVFPENSMKYDEKSWAHISLLNQAALGLLIQGNSEIKNYNQLKIYVRQHPDKFTIATVNSFFGNIYTEWARREGLPPPVIVLYKGSLPAVTDVMSGNVLIAFDSIGWGSPSIPYVESKKLKVLAMFDSNQSKLAQHYVKENKSIVNLGDVYPDFKFSAVFVGLSAPAGTPHYVVNEINQVLLAARRDPRYKQKINELTGFATTPTEYSQYVDENLARLRKLSLTIKSN